MDNWVNGEILGDGSQLQNLSDLDKIAIVNWKRQQDCSENKYSDPLRETGS